MIVNFMMSMKMPMDDVFVCALVICLLLFFCACFRQLEGRASEVHQSRPAATGLWWNKM